MYDVTLTEAYFPAQADTEYRERTIEEVLREGLADGSICREWGYAELLTEGAERPDDQELRSFIRERLSPQKTPADRLRQDPEVPTGGEL